MESNLSSLSNMIVNPGYVLVLAINQADGIAEKTLPPTYK
jgi:hypothetical protein